MSLMGRVEERWQQRQAGTEPLTVQARTTIAADREQVWQFLLAPQSAFLCSDGVLKAFHVPGTPIGSVGEQQCMVVEQQGQVLAHIVEVVELRPIELAVTRTVTSPSGMISRYVMEDAASGGTCLTYQFGAHMVLGSRKKAEPPIREHVDTAVRRIKSAIESGATFSDARKPSTDLDSDAPTA
ncbi:hypothetical protein N864_16430 [Intrasporangium chromatireducens Q5-1]|uniref:Polyketide cyclase n=1 Tax=Intrasporangium chromatireducens Q5-1 TaxID=584657 RepID=W9GL47_9MICO|nr:hypothetical protein [Intrasporangium chromatireducens]EWT06835.1 hypothetical protein N864_16430 [Intrasporangium chromatireducens Q5-1]